VASIHSFARPSWGLERARRLRHLVEELAQILADALHEDIKQYPNLSDIPPLMEPTVVSRGSDRKRRLRAGPSQRGQRRGRQNIG
jgi:hypothetical protein